MKKIRKGMALTLIAALFLSGMYGNDIQAAKQMKLSPKAMTLTAGQSKKLKVQNKKGKVQWKSSKKKVASVSQSGKVKAKQPGKANVTATVTSGNKKTVLKCRVTVKAKKKVTATATPGMEINGNSNGDTNLPKATQPSTVKPGAAATQLPLPRPSSASSQTPEDILGDEGEYDDSIQIRSVEFKDSSILCQVSGTYIYMDLSATSKTSLKEAVPDLKDCTWVISRKGYQVDEFFVSNIVWHEEPYYSSSADHGFYSFNICVKDGGNIYKKSIIMLEALYQHGINKGTVIGKITTGDGTAMSGYRSIHFISTEASANDTERHVKTDADGFYCVSLPEGTYRIRKWMGGDDYLYYGEVTVTKGKIVTQDIKTDFYRISGTALRLSNAFEEEVLLFSGKDNYEDCTTGARGQYELYLLPDEYEIYTSINRMKIGEISVTDKSITYDINANLVKITGKMYRDASNPVVSGEQPQYEIDVKGEVKGFFSHSGYVDENGNYRMYVPAETEYSVTLIGEDITKTFTSSAEDEVMDIVFEDTTVKDQNVKKDFSVTGLVNRLIRFMQERR